MRAPPVLLAGLALLFAAPARAEPVHGRLQLQDVVAIDPADSLAAALGQRTRNDLQGDLRLSWSPQKGPWSFDAAYILAVDAGDGPALAAAQDAFGLYPPAPPASWLDLTDRLANERHLTVTQRIDRLSIGYAAGPVVVRAGRQALSWGEGLVFRPMDLLDPFAPDATDTEYKPGTDMLYGQYLFDDGADVQAAIVPRPARAGGKLAADASSFALLARRQFGAVEATGLVARDRGDVVAGFGLGGPLGGASWNVELVPTFLSGGGSRLSALANMSSAGKLAGRDISYFAEYYHNGFGLGGSGYTLAGFPAPLLDRLLRGQLFNSGRDYLAAGARLQWTPLLEINPTLIANLSDGSAYLLTEAHWSLGDNLTLNVGGQLPIGRKGTEYGGLGLAADAPPYLTQPGRLYVQLRRYF